MACTNEKNRSDDKYTTYQNASVDADTAIAAAGVATAAAVVACPFFWTGLGTAACATAVAAALAADAASIAASRKRNNAFSAYWTAFQAYMNCLSKCKKK